MPAERSLLNTLHIELGILETDDTHGRTGGDEAGFRHAIVRLALDVDRAGRAQHGDRHAPLANQLRQRGSGNGLLQIRVQRQPAQRASMADAVGEPHHQREAYPKPQQHRQRRPARIETGHAAEVEIPVIQQAHRQSAHDQHDPADTRHPETGDDKHLQQDKDNTDDEQQNLPIRRQAIYI